MDASGNIYIADTANHRIRKVTGDGIIQTIAGSDAYGTSGDGGPAAQALLINPRELVFDRDGNLLFTDSSAHVVRRITAAGIIERVSGTGAPGYSGDGGAAISARDWTPWGLAVDASGNILVGDTGTSTIRIIDRSGTIRTLVSGIQATGLAADPTGNLWVTGTSGLSLYSQGGPTIPLAPVIANKGIANAQSGQTSVIAPGEMVTIGGSYLGPAVAVSDSGAGGALVTQLAGVRVLFDGIAAPVLQVSASQILAVVPFAVAGKNTVDVRVEYNGATSNTATIGVFPAVPGIFSDQYRVYAIGLNVPAVPGSIISLFVTGPGAMVPPETDGAIGTAQTSVPALPVSAFLYLPSPDGTSFASQPLEVTYAGSSSWLISGTIQVNIRLPDQPPTPSYVGYQIAVRVGDSLSPSVRVPLQGQ